jgi:hypothetical protein
MLLSLKAHERQAYEVALDWHLFAHYLAVAECPECESLTVAFLHALPPGILFYILLFFLTGDFITAAKQLISRDDRGENDMEEPLLLPSEE